MSPYHLARHEGWGCGKGSALVSNLPQIRVNIHLPISSYLAARIWGRTVG